MAYENLTVDRHGQIFVITLCKKPENRITQRFAQEIIRALRDIERDLGVGAEGAVITRGSDEKFWCTVCLKISMLKVQPGGSMVAGRMCKMP